MFLSLLPVEKPALGRGLDALMSSRKGDSGKKATDMLMPFQAKRTRVGKGLGAFLKGGQRIDSTAEPQPATPGKPQAAPAPPAVSSLRASRPARPTSQPVPNPVPQLATTPANYRRSRRPRPANPEAPPAPDKSEPAPAAVVNPFVAAPESATPAPSKSALEPNPESAATGEPAFQRPFVRKRPSYLRKEDIPKQPEPAGASPAFRLSLFVVDLFLSGGAFYVAYYGPKGNYLLLLLCCLAVVIGAALGVWSFKLEPTGEE